MIRKYLRILPEISLLGPEEVCDKIAPRRNWQDYLSEILVARDTVIVHQYHHMYAVDYIPSHIEKLRPGFMRYHDLVGFEPHDGTFITALPIRDETDIMWLILALS
jgi:hypothetical protein